MTLDQQQNHFDYFANKQSEILFKKGNDYADSDRLSNFKVSGAICQLTPSRQCLSMIATKVARLGVLLKNETPPENESVRDSVIDLGNYTFLLDCLLKEEEDIQKDNLAIKLKKATEEVKTRNEILNQ